MAAVKLLVIEAMRNTVSAVGGVSLPHDRRSDAAGMQELAADDHAVRDAGHRLLGDERIDQAIHLGQRVVDRHAPDYSRASPTGGCERTSSSERVVQADGRFLAERCA